MSYITNITGGPDGLERLGSITIGGPSRLSTRQTEGDYSNILDVDIASQTVLTNRFEEPPLAVLISGSGVAGGGSFDIATAFTGNFVPVSGNYNIGAPGSTVGNAYINKLYTNGIYSSGNITGGVFSAIDGTTTFTASNGVMRVGLGYLYFGFGDDSRIGRLNRGYTYVDSPAYPNESQVFVVPNTYSGNLNTHSEMLQVGWFNNSGFVRSVSSGTGIYRPLGFEAGSGAQKTSFVLTTSNLAIVSNLTSPGMISGATIQSNDALISGGTFYGPFAATAALQSRNGNNVQIGGGTVNFNTNSLQFNGDIQYARTAGGTYFNYQSSSTPIVPTFCRRYSSSSNFEGLLFEVGNTSGIKLKANAGTTGTYWPMFLEAGSGTGMTTLGVTTQNMISVNTPPQSAAAVASTHKIPISINGVVYYLLVSNV